MSEERFAFAAGERHYRGFAAVPARDYCKRSTREVI